MLQDHDKERIVTGSVGVDGDRIENWRKSIGAALSGAQIRHHDAVLYGAVGINFQRFIGLGDKIAKDGETDRHDDPQDHHDHQRL
jgi:hypothetical protein